MSNAIRFPVKGNRSGGIKSQVLSFRSFEQILARVFFLHTVMSTRFQDGLNHLKAVKERFKDIRLKIYVFLKQNHSDNY